MKVQISLADELMERIDVYSAENYLSRSGLVSLACAQYLNAVEVTKAIKDIAISIRKIADTGVLDDETRRQLEDFERLAKIMSGR